MEFLEFLKAILFGIVEGITEWLPISSTGHMILLEELLPLKLSEEFLEMFFVVIQLGAIAAVPVLFFDKLWPFGKNKSAEERKRTLSLWGKVIVGVIPAAVLGVIFDDLLDKYLYNYPVVATTLILYGIIFIILEKRNKNREFRVKEVWDLTYRDAFIIGTYQVLSLIPGTSRSGSTIIGGMLTGVSRTASSEFSFFMAIPVMLGASLLKVAKLVLDGYTASGTEIGILLVGIVVSFVVSLFAIKFLMEFVKHHSFAPFGVYRIVIGAIVIIYFLIRL